MVKAAEPAALPPRRRFALGFNWRDQTKIGVAALEGNGIPFPTIASLIPGADSVAIVKADVLPPDARPFDWTGKAQGLPPGGVCVFAGKNAAALLSEKDPLFLLRLIDKDGEIKERDCASLLPEELRYELPTEALVCAIGEQNPGAVKEVRHQDGNRDRIVAYCVENLGRELGKFPAVAALAPAAEGKDGRGGKRKRKGERKEKEKYDEDALLTEQEQAKADGISLRKFVEKCRSSNSDLKAGARAAFNRIDKSLVWDKKQGTFPEWNTMRSRVVKHRK